MIVEHFGGRTWVEDAPGGGAIFRVWLPRKMATASA
jgi:signal transduction histidine kinase